MNQILNSTELLDKNTYNSRNTKKKNFIFFKFQFIFCSVIAFLVTGYYLYLQYDKRQNEILAEEIVQNLSITNLYKNYETSRLSNDNIYQTDSSVFEVIGLIEIKSIGVYYPIINEFDYELLKIAPCKFLGPNPNEIRKSLYCRS